MRRATCINVEPGAATLELETGATLTVPATAREFDVGEVYQIMFRLGAPRDQAVDVTKCRPAHEVRCPHRSDHYWRWSTGDGCAGHLCDRCWWEPGSPREWRELVALCGTDKDRIPIDPSVWTQADHLGALMRGS